MCDLVQSGPLDLDVGIQPMLLNVKTFQVSLKRATFGKVHKKTAK